MQAQRWLFVGAFRLFLSSHSSTAPPGKSDLPGETRTLVCLIRVTLDILTFSLLDGWICLAYRSDVIE